MVMLSDCVERLNGRVCEAESGVPFLVRKAWLSTACQQDCRCVGMAAGGRVMKGRPANLVLSVGIDAVAQQLLHRRDVTGRRGRREPRASISAG